MRGLSGEEAVARLERRGGQVWVFRQGYGSAYSFLSTRADGVLAVAVRREGGAVGRRPKDREVRTDADRTALARDMEAVRDAANAPLAEGVAHRYVLTHRDQLQADGGYAQVGCVLAIGSVLVGLIVGEIAVWLTTETLAGWPAVWAVVVGFVIGFFGIEPIAAVLVLFPPLRDRIEVIAYSWMGIVPGVVTAIATPILTTILDSRPDFAF
jgi:hypothetical protein